MAKGRFAYKPMITVPKIAVTMVATSEASAGMPAAFGYHWQSALGAVFLGGLLFLVLTVFRLRQWLLDAIPNTLRYSFAVVATAGSCAPAQPPVLSVELCTL